jgi:hypothetical protein
MSRRRRQSLALSGKHARQALAILIQEGKLAADEVKKALQRRDRLIRALRASLEALGEGIGKAGRQVAKHTPLPLLGKTVARTRSRLAKRARPRISAATRRKYQQQGRYMAAVRPLPKAARAKVKAIREKSGVPAAIAAAKRMAR